MKLIKANSDAIRHSCKYFHYAKRVPCVTIGFSVFNNKNEWCGTICYGPGANNSIGKMYKLAQGEVLELVRVALNGKQETTSKALSISLKLIKKYYKHVKLIVSYADSGQKHKGTIYQATNWYYHHSTLNDSSDTLILNGKEYHSRSLNRRNKDGSYDSVAMKLRIAKKSGKLKYKKAKTKYKYIYPLSEDMREYCEQNKKSYAEVV